LKNRIISKNQDAEAINPATRDTKTSSFQRIELIDNLIFFGVCQEYHTEESPRTMLTRSALIYLSRQEGLKEFAAKFSFSRSSRRASSPETTDEAVAGYAKLTRADFGVIRSSERVSW